MIEMLSDMFGSDCIGKMIKGNTVSVTVDDKVATVNVETLVRTKFKITRLRSVYNKDVVRHVWFRLYQ